MAPMADNEMIYSALCEIQETVGDIRGQLGRIEERCLARGQMIDGLKKTVYGENGRGGNTRQITLNCDAITQLKKARSSWGGFWRDVARIVVAAAILAVIGWFLVLYRAAS